LKEEKQRLCGYPDDQQDAAGRYTQHDERSEMMIIRLLRWRHSDRHFFLSGIGNLLRVMAKGGN
jgi:hypothetical protein